MRFSHFVAAVSATAALGALTAAPTAVAAPAAAPAACTWTMSELRAPTGYSYAEARGHAGTGKVVGTVWKTDHREAVVWTNGTPTLLPQPRSTGGSNYAKAVNAKGVVAGYWMGNDGTSFAWRYQNGQYQTLPGIGTEDSIPTHINVNGDVLGYSGYFGPITTVHAVMWRADRPTTVLDLGEGYSAGFDDSRRAVLSTGAIVDGEGKELLRLQGGRPMEMRAGRIVGYSGSAQPYTIVEWNLTGTVVRRISGGVPNEVNSSGVIAGSRTGGVRTVWRNGTTQDITNPVARGYNMTGITDDGAVISDYEVGDERHSGIWRSSC